MAIVLLINICSINITGKNKENIVNKKLLTITIGNYEKISVYNSKKVNWISEDTSIVSVNDGIVFAKKYGNTHIIAKLYDNNDQDTIGVSVVNWTSERSKLEIINTLDDFNLLAIKGDTLFAAGAGNARNYNYLYMISNDMKDIQIINEFPFKPENMLITPFGYFVLSRTSANMPRGIYKSDLSLKKWRNVLLNIGESINGRDADSYLLNEGWCNDDSNLFVGEYNVNYKNFPVYQIHLLKGSNFGEKWNEVYKFPERDISRNSGVDHIHCCQIDSFTGNIWLGTGDPDEASGIYYNTNKFVLDEEDHTKLNLLGNGSQEYRVVSYYFTKEYIYWFMDAPFYPQKIFRLKKSNMELQKKGVYDYRENIHCIKDKPFYYNKQIENNNEKIDIISTVYEGINEYLSPNDYIEVDKNNRIFGLKEMNNGDVQVQELLSIPVDHKYSHIDPIGQDKKGYIYFTANTIGNKFSIIKTKLIWNDIDCKYIQSGKRQEISLPLSKIILNIDNTESGTLCSYLRDTIMYSDRIYDKNNIIKYIWYLYPNIISPENIYIKIQKEDYPELSKNDTITFLYRNNQNNKWEDIGISISDKYLSSVRPISKIPCEVAISVRNRSCSSPVTNTTIENNMPKVFQNYPNPFNNKTTIEYYLPYLANVDLTIVNNIGQKISEYKIGNMEKGYHNYNINVSKLSTGVYYYIMSFSSNINGSQFIKNNKFIVIK